MGFFDRKPQDAAATAQQQEALQQAGVPSGGFDPMEAMRRAGIDPNTVMASGMSSMGGMNIQEQMAERDKIQRVNASGVPGRATVISAEAGATSPGGVGTITRFQLSVTEGPGAGSTVNVQQSMLGDTAWYQPGQSVALKVNPANPQELLITGS